MLMEDYVELDSNEGGGGGVNLNPSFQLHTCTHCSLADLVRAPLLVGRRQCALQSSQLATLTAH